VTEPVAPRCDFCSDAREDLAPASCLTLDGRLVTTMICFRCYRDAIGDHDDLARTMSARVAPDLSSGGQGATRARPSARGEAIEVSPAPGEARRL